MDRVAAQLGQSSLNMRETLYTRKGGVLFGTAHLFYYPTHYEQMLYRLLIITRGITPVAMRDFRRWWRNWRRSLWLRMDVI